MNNRNCFTHPGLAPCLAFPDVYLRPHNIGHFKLLDYHLMDRIAKDAYK
jgi:hypothetical protein